VTLVCEHTCQPTYFVAPLPPPPSHPPSLTRLMRARAGAGGGQGAAAVEPAARDASRGAGCGCGCGRGHGLLARSRGGAGYHHPRRDGRRGRRRRRLPCVPLRAARRWRAARCLSQRGVCQPISARCRPVPSLCFHTFKTFPCIFTHSRPFLVFLHIQDLFLCFHSFKASHNPHTEHLSLRAPRGGQVDADAQQKLRRQERERSALGKVPPPPRSRGGPVCARAA
jgi:hypothetical protein